MAFSNLAVNAAGLLNQFAWPVSLANIGWHTYIIFVIWCAIQWAVLYFFLPETKKRTVSRDSSTLSQTICQILIEHLPCSLKNSTPYSPIAAQSRLLFKFTNSPWIRSITLSKRRRYRLHFCTDYYFHYSLDTYNGWS